MRDRQRDVLHGVLTHLDFLAVSMTEIMRAAVELELTGEAPVLENPTYLLNHSLNVIEIECLPRYARAYYGGRKLHQNPRRQHHHR